MNASELATRWNCTIRSLETLQKKGILKADQKHVRGERDFALSHVEDIEKEYNIFTDFITIEDFAKEYHLHYNTIYLWVRAGKLPSCRLFNPIRIPVDAKPSTIKEGSMKVFSREKYLSVMYKINPNGAERRRGYVWPSQCDGKTEEECTALGYRITPDWMEETI